MIAVAALAVLGMAGYALLSSDKTNKICTWRELRDVMGDGIKCSKNVQLSEHQSFQHILMVAPSGCGKSRRFLAHNLDLPGSIIVTDPVGELAKMYQGDKYVINPFGNGIGYDPLKNCRSEFEVRKIAKVILMNGAVKDNPHQQEWVDMATPLLTAYMLYNYGTKAYSFAEMIKNICIAPILDKGPCLYDEILHSNVKSAKVEMNSFMQVSGSEKTLSSIRSVLNTCLQMFLDAKVQSLMSKPSIDLSVFRKEESALFIQIPERHSSYFAPLTATLISQLIDRLLDDEGVQTYLLLDEMTNIGKLPDFSKLLSTARKHNLSICACIQSLLQLETAYKDEGKEIRELFKTILVTGGLKDSAEYISKLLGTIPDKETKMPLDLMTADEIRRLDKDEMLIICNNKRPVLDRMMEVVHEID